MANLSMVIHGVYTPEDQDSATAHAQEVAHTLEERKKINFVNTIWPARPSKARLMPP